jgi:uncharacterized repeat protein (TIGR03843 family)
MELLTRGELHPLGLMPRASNYTFLAEVSDGGRSTLAVYKPRRGETPLWDFPDGTLCAREVAAYLLGSALGWPSVPPTILRDGPHGPGSVQLFIDADLSQHFFTLRETCLESFQPVAVFDAIANNGDRKAGHCLLDPSGTVWVVDHGVCFSEEPKLRTVIWEFAGDEIPAPLLADVARVRDALASGSLRGSLVGLLSEGEVDATRERAEALIETARFPRPGPTRPFPWPPV